MPILPLGQKANTLTIGGSPRGWTFISTASCWFRFLLRYVLGYFPAASKSYFDLGDAYHMLMEGQGVDAVRNKYPEHVAEAMRLHAIREKKGPPLGKAVALEKEHALFDGKMTSKPDREEPGRIRDYKTAFGFKDSDDKKWNTAGGIIGEAIAGKVPVALVDIVSKREGKAEHNATEKPVKVITVHVDEKKAAALEEHVNEFWAQLEARITKAAKAPSDAAALRAFPRDLNQCVGDYGPCDYYDYCWGKPPESMLYRLSPEPPRRWVTGREDAPLKLPGKLTAKVIEAVSKRLRAKLFNQK